MNAKQIREMLARDFGTDLPISGGSGQTLGSPVVIEVSNQVEAAVVQVSFLRLLGLGRSIHWRTLGRAPIRDEGSAIEQYKIETLQLVGDDLHRTVENYYFDLRRVAPSGPTLVTPDAFAQPQGLIIRLPAEVAWLHHVRTVDYSRLGQPDLGHGCEYVATGIKATIYVYRRATPITKDNFPSGELEKHFQTAVMDLYRVIPGAEAIRDPVRANEQIIQAFRYQGMRGVVFLARAQDQWLKVRITYQDDDLLRTLVNRSIETLIDLINAYVQE